MIDPFLLRPLSRDDKTTSAQRETAATEVGGEDETSRPHILVATQRITVDSARQRKVHARSL